MTIENKVTDYVRQIIVIRKDLHMPTGKVAAMAAHAAMTFISHRLRSAQEVDRIDGYRFMEIPFSEAEYEWMTELDPGLEDQGQVSFAKIVVMAIGERDLLLIEDAAIKAELEVHRVIDSGYSHNKPNTWVGIAIGPDTPERLNPVTGELPLYR